MPVVKHEPEFVEVDGHGRCEVLVVPKLSPSVQRRAYKKDSMTHPAKMDTMLCREIIRRYTREGNLVLDPMCGISTTQLEAALLGRVAIGVELEERFVKISEENIRRLGKLAPRGRAAVIKGDARELSKILKGKADVAVFSPPFFTITEERGDKREGPNDIAAKMLRGDPQHKGCYLPFTKDKRNIHKIRDYGRIDAVVTSPPFGEAKHDYKHGLKKLGPNFKGRKAWEEKRRVKTSAENIENLPYKPVDAIVTSPPFAQTPGGVTGEKNITAQLLEGRPTRASRSTFARTMISKDERNIDNLATTKYGQVDAVITSPPYKTANEGGGLNKRPPKTFRGVLKKHSFKLSGNPQNVDNIPYGRIDTIVTSPPFEKTLARENPNRKRGYWKGSGGYQSGRGTEGYGETEGNIGALPHGQIDAVITSPPYSESMTKRRKGYTTNPQLSKTRHMGVESSDENIGNLPHGQVDAVITSPPYSEGIGHDPGEGANEEFKQRLDMQRRYTRSMRSEGNVGSLPHGRVDAVITSSPYEGSLESTTRHTKGGIPGRDKKLGQTGFYPSENRDNIGSKKGETYLSAMLRVYRECLGVLRPGGRMVLVLKDFVRNKKVVRLDLDTKRLCEVAGFRWVETKLFRLPSKSFWRTLYSKKYPDVDTSLLKFEFVEVFERPTEAYT